MLSVDKSEVTSERTANCRREENVGKGARGPWGTEEAEAAARPTLPRRPCH